MSAERPSPAKAAPFAAALIAASLLAAPPAFAAPRLELRLTVAPFFGGDEFCPPTEFALVVPHQTVILCYQATNTGDESLDVHSVFDSELGVVLDEFPFMLVPAASVFLTETAQVSELTEFFAVWTATGAGGDAQGFDSVVVLVPEPASAWSGLAAVASIVLVARSRSTRATGSSAASGAR